MMKLINEGIGTHKTKHYRISQGLYIQPRGMQHKASPIIIKRADKINFWTKSIVF